MHSSKDVIQPIKIEDAITVLKWAKENSRFYTLLASEMLAAIPSSFKDNEVLSETYLQTTSKVFTGMPVNFLGGLSSIIEGEMKSTKLKQPENKEYRDKFIQLDQVINQR